MITRILIFLALMIGWLVVYRLADPTGAADLLSTIQNFSFSGNKNSSYTTTILSGSGDQIISQTGNSLTPLSTGATASTGVSALSILTQIWNQTNDLIQQNNIDSGSVADTGDENDDILDTINDLINPVETGNMIHTWSLNNNTGIMTTWTTASGSTNIAKPVTNTPKPVTTPKPKPTTSTTITPKPTTTPSSLSQKDRNDAEYFLQFMDVE